ncbi:hypothetical protein AB0D13_31215 [Streptomyces sp. NPDC048430]|uniref:hypothetical protein n=1 Tax=unclassified Streptomyces TaxID=2593676 RepID=UPI0034262423
MDEQQSSSPPKSSMESSNPSPSGSAPQTAPLWEDSEDGVLLTGWICHRCNQRGLPRQHFGCERCGAPSDAIGESKFAARGILRSSAVIRRHAFWPVPFVMGEIQLESGHMIHAFLSEDITWSPGARVVGQGGDELRQSYVVFTMGEH